jgi:hypothetical protein
MDAVAVLVEALPAVTVAVLLIVVVPLGSGAATVTLYVNARDDPPASVARSKTT